MRTEKETEGFAPGARPVCVFCNTPWSDDMIKTMHQTEVETGYYGDVEAVELREIIDITCHKCQRVIYRKEIAKHIPGYNWSDSWY